MINFEGKRNINECLKVFYKEFIGVLDLNLPTKKVSLERVVTSTNNKRSLEGSLNIIIFLNKPNSLLKT